MCEESMKTGTNICEDVLKGDTPKCHVCADVKHLIKIKIPLQNLILISNRENIISWYSTVGNGAYRWCWSQIDDTLQKL